MTLFDGELEEPMHERLRGCICFKPCASLEICPTATAKRFDNSSKPAAYREVEPHFRAGTCRARLFAFCKSVANNGHTYTSDELATASGSHRYGGILHDLKKDFPQLSWDVYKDEVHGARYVFHWEAGTQ